MHSFRDISPNIKSNEMMKYLEN